MCIRDSSKTKESDEASNLKLLRFKKDNTNKTTKITESNLGDAVINLAKDFDIIFT